MGPTIFLNLYNTIFTTSLKSELADHAPNTNAASVVAAGATQFRKLVGAADLPAVLVAYSNSLDRVFYLVAAAGCVAFAAAFGMGFKDIRKTGKDKPASPTNEPAA